jgi:bacillopeptidase F (M6 metalloprotease family)
MVNTTFTGPVRSENGFEDITKNATTGVNTVNATYGQSIRGGVQGLTGAGAVDLTNLITELTTTGANALTLADGSISGQVKIVNMIVDGGDGTLTPVTFANGTTITFDAVAESATLVWNSTIGWVATSVQGATIA